MAHIFGEIKHIHLIIYSFEQINLKLHKAYNSLIEHYKESKTEHIEKLKQINKQ